MRRLAQLIVWLLVLAWAFPHLPASIRRTAIDLAILVLVVLAFCMVLRPLGRGLLPKPRPRERRRRDWFTG